MIRIMCLVAVLATSGCLEISRQQAVLEQEDVQDTVLVDAGDTVSTDDVEGVDGAVEVADVNVETVEEVDASSDDADTFDLFETETADAVDVAEEVDVVADVMADVVEEVDAGDVVPDMVDADADEVGNADVVEVEDMSPDTPELPETDAVVDVSETDAGDAGPDVLDTVEPLCQADSDCDDGDECTSDTCDPVDGCVYEGVVPCTIFVPGGLYMDNPTPPGVDVGPFFMDWHEVRLKDYVECVSAGECSTPASATSFFPACTWGDSDGSKPVNCVTFMQAEEYCTYRGGRLPTRHEHRKAARGGCELNGLPGCNAQDDFRSYPWGDEPPSCTLTVFNEDGDKGCGEFGPWPVGSKSPAGDSPYGFHDLVGNLWEILNETCGDENTVLGGGSWETAPEFMSIDWYFCVGIATQAGGHHNAGFRCVYD